VELGELTHVPLPLTIKKKRVKKENG
jgi:hypothetical protein